MRLIRHETNVPALPLPNETRVVLTTEQPDPRLVTGAFVLAFVDDEIVLTKLKQRGWDIPGGHVEPGEDPVEAGKRELYEETGAVVEQLRFLGYELIRLFQKPEHYRYPYPDSYMVFYCAKVLRLDPFAATDETSERRRFSPEDARQISWVQDNMAFYEEALRIVSSLE